MRTAGFCSNATVLPGIRIGKGSTIGACSVVMKDVPAFHVEAGNSERIVRKIESKLSEELSEQATATHPLSNTASS